MEAITRQDLKGAYYCDHCGKKFYVSCLWAHSQLVIVENGRSQLFDLCPECVAPLRVKIDETYINNLSLIKKEKE